MARIAGVNIPAEKRIEIALRYIHGIGPARAAKICEALKLKDGLRAKDLTDADVIKISNYIEQNFKVEGDVRREVAMNIKRLQDLKTYRGIRHRNRWFNRCRLFVFACFLDICRILRDLSCIVHIGCGETWEGCYRNK